MRAASFCDDFFASMRCVWYGMRYVWRLRKKNQQKKNFFSTQVMALKPFTMVYSTLLIPYGHRIWFHITITGFGFQGKKFFFQQERFAQCTTKFRRGCLLHACIVSLDFLSSRVIHFDKNWQSTSEKYFWKVFIATLFWVLVQNFVRRMFR